MHYYYLKIGPGNSLASSWLNGDNPLKRPAAVIHFERCTIEDIRNGKSDPQAKNFYESSSFNLRSETVMVVIAHGKAWFLRPAGDLMEYDSPTDAVNLWKIMPVEIISEQKLTEIPPILASISANAFLNRGTYRKISNWGNIKAICYSLKTPLPDEHLEARAHSPLRLLECLSSIELETLVAKVFEAAGCFVPAYRGGQIRDVDLFVHNDDTTEKKLGALTIPPRSGISVQVKGRTTLKECPETADYLIGFGVPKSLKTFDEIWLLNQVKIFPNVRGWLKRSLNWLPKDFVARCGL